MDTSNQYSSLTLFEFCRRTVPSVIGRLYLLLHRLSTNYSPFLSQNRSRGRGRYLTMKDANQDALDCLPGLGETTWKKWFFSKGSSKENWGNKIYWKGTLTIIEENLHLNYKKFLSKRQILKIPRSKIARAGFKNVEGLLKSLGRLPRENGTGWFLSSI